MHSGIAVSRLMPSGIACLASQTPDWAVAFWGWPVQPVIGWSMIGAHPSVSIVSLAMIGYHCNCLDGQLNYQAFTHWLIGGATNDQLCNW